MNMRKGEKWKGEREKRGKGESEKREDWRFRRYR